MTNPPKGQRVVINEGTLKKNLNPPPTSERPPPPKAQTAPPSQKKKETRPCGQTGPGAGAAGAAWAVQHRRGHGGDALIG